MPRKIQVYIDALNSADQNLLLSPWVREQAKAVLKELIDPARPAKADPVSFSVGHIVAALWCLDRLRVRSVTCSPVPWSSKVTATISPTRLLRQALFVGLPTQFDADSYTKRTTGDGLALLRVLTGVARNPNKPISRQPPALVMRASATGSDDGSADDIIQIGLTVGELAPTPENQHDAEQSNDIKSLWETHREMHILEANLDDMTPEHLAFAMDLLLQEGGADAWVTPIIMKKARAAQQLNVLCHAAQMDDFLKIIFTHTTTLGVRVKTCDRMALKRQMMSVQLPEYDEAVDVKMGFLGDDMVTAMAEYDHCHRLAAKTGTPIHVISKKAVNKAQAVMKKHGKTEVDEAS